MYIAIVVDPNFRFLKDIAVEMPVWILETPSNRARAEELWKDVKAGTATFDITTFKSDPSDPIEAALDKIETIELHHPDLTGIEIIGVFATPQLKTSLSAAGYEAFKTVGNRFRADKVVEIQ
jgi:hypothetical protein